MSYEIIVFVAVLVIYINGCNIVRKKGLLENEFFRHPLVKMLAFIGVFSFTVFVKGKINEEIGFSMHNMLYNVMYDLGFVALIGSANSIIHKREGLRRRHL